MKITLIIQNQCVLKLNSISNALFRFVTRSEKSTKSKSKWVGFKAKKKKLK